MNTLQCNFIKERSPVEIERNKEYGNVKPLKSVRQIFCNPSANRSVGRTDGQTNKPHRWRGKTLGFEEWNTFTIVTGETGSSFNKVIHMSVCRCLRIGYAFGLLSISSSSSFLHPHHPAPTYNSRGGDYHLNPRTADVIQLRNRKFPSGTGNTLSP